MSFGIPILDNLYPATMDLWPIQAKEFNMVYPFYENLKQGSRAPCGRVD